MREKESILEEVSSDNTISSLSALEVLIDIRDILNSLSNKIKILSKAGTPGSPPPPEVR